MWDDQHDKEMMRNQMVAIMLMTLLILGWYTFFVPTPLSRPPIAAPVQPVDFPEEPAQPKGVGFSTAEPSPLETADPLSLPPVAEQTDLAGDEVYIANEHLELTFTRIGGRLKWASVTLRENGGDSIQFVPESDRPDPETVYPLGLRFTNALGDEIDRRRFDVEVHRDGRALTFTFEIPGVAQIRKTFRLAEEAYVLDATIEYENTSASRAVLGQDRTPAYHLTWGPSVETGEEDRYYSSKFVWRQNLEADTLDASDLPQQNGVPEVRNLRQIEWLGYKSKYFIVAMKPEFDLADGFVLGTEDQFRFGFSVARFSLEPGETHSSGYRLYLGPMQLATLGDAWPTLPSALRFFDSVDFMDSFAKLLLRILNWFYDHVLASYGVAIILLTLVVRVFMFPLTLKSMKSMKKMQLLAPEMEVLREKHKEDQQELSRKMMEMYKERGVNPLGGCFPMLLQMPVFIALYRMLWNAFELRGAPFLWVGDLSEPDRLFRIPGVSSIPFIGQYIEYFNLLPILMGIAMVISMKLMPAAGPAQNPQQKMMMTMMPIFFSVVCYNLAAGLNLYVLTSTVLGMVQQRFVRVGKEEMKKDAAKRKDVQKKRKQNFYARAMERQRQMKKSSKGKTKARR